MFIRGTKAPLYNTEMGFAFDNRSNYCPKAIFTLMPPAKRDVLSTN